jgi:hypothetical protein
MAYRIPHSDKHEARHRHQNVLARLVGGILVIALAGLGFLCADWTIAPEHLLWKPLSVNDPIGIATRPKLTRQSFDPLQCRSVLTQGGIYYQNIPDQHAPEGCDVKNALMITGGVATLSPLGAPLSCEIALAYAVWNRQVVDQAAVEYFGSPVVHIDHFGTYSCRKIAGDGPKPLSEHAFANAIDVSGFRLADGREVSVEKDWSDPGPKGQFLHKVRDGACRVFGMVLSPDYNPAHKNHLHVDMSIYRECH